MVGSVIVSHGVFAQVVLETAELFVGETEQVVCVSLMAGDDPEKFSLKMRQACQSVDTGDGVIILADLFGGTPSNQACLLVSDRIHVISGYNLGLVIEVLNARSDPSLDLSAIVEEAKQSMVYANTLF